MASLITEVHISYDGLEFTKLDLHKDEKIIMKFTQKNLQDISKILAPYSQNFTFPATLNNRKAFEFFGDTDVVKINKERKYFCKIYSSGQLFQNGYLILSDISYKNGKPQDFTGSFGNNITNLKDRIGEDTLNDLGSYQLVWNPSKAYQLIQGTESFTIDGINYLYYVPLISNSRVWSYDTDSTSTVKDNIVFKNGTDPLGNNLVKSSELKPAMAFRTIFDLIKKKYELDIVMPLENEERYKKLFVWCNSDSVLNSSYKKLILKNNFAPNFYTNILLEFVPFKYTANYNFVNNSILITKNNNNPSPYPNYPNSFFTITFTFENIFINSESETSASVDISLIKLTETDAFITKSFDFTNGSPSFSIQIPDIFFEINDTLEFFIYTKFNNPVNWNNLKVRIEFVLFRIVPSINNPTQNIPFLQTLFQESKVNNNAVESGAGKIDLIKALPNTKVIDFLNSFIKSFNLSIYDTSPDNNTLYWLTPKDINTQGLTYSKATFDYTPYVDLETTKKSVPSDFNYYNFKHVTSKYRSNVDFKSANGIEYGQTQYPILTDAQKKALKVREFKVETNFSIIPPRIVDGSNGIITAYGFNSDTPTLLDSGESRYKPNYNELTLFYCNNNNTVIEPMGFQYQPVGGAFNYVILDSYLISTPFRNDFSLAFSVLKNQNVEYPINLFSEYYQQQIIRYLDTNVLSQEFKLTLPASELYLNEFTYVQDGGVTPIGFRLQNDIIIKEDKYTILDASIDVTTGESNMTLLNY